MLSLVHILKVSKRIMKYTIFFKKNRMHTWAVKLQPFTVVSSTCIALGKMLACFFTYKEIYAERIYIRQKETCPPFEQNHEEPT